MGFKKLMPVMFLIVFAILGSTFLTQTLGSVEAGANTSTSYQNQYNSTRDVSITTISFTKFIAPILGVVALVIAVTWINKSIHR